MGGTLDDLGKHLWWQPMHRTRQVPERANQSQETVCPGFEVFNLKDMPCKSPPPPHSLKTSSPWILQERLKPYAGDRSLATWRTPNRVSRRIHRRALGWRVRTASRDMVETGEEEGDGFRECQFPPGLHSRASFDDSARSESELLLPVWVFRCTRFRAPGY